MCVGISWRSPEKCLFDVSREENNVSDNLKKKRKFQGFEVHLRRNNIKHELWQNEI